MVTTRQTLDRSTQLCVARHGETDWNITGILQGWLDVPLNDNGRRQSFELADSLAPWRFSAVCSSPLWRCTETAEIVANAWGLGSPELYEGLKERNFGQIQGMPKRDLARSHPGLHQEITRRNPACHFDDGETLDHFADRVLDALHAVAETHGGQRVLIITHGWVMDVITRHLRNLPRTAILDMKRKNGESLWLGVDSDSRFYEMDAAPLAP